MRIYWVPMWACKTTKVPKPQMKKQTMLNLYDPANNLITQLAQAGYSVICDQHNWETNDPCVILPRQQCTTHDDVGLGETNQSLFYWLFFWCLDTKTYKKCFIILTLEDIKKFDRKFGKRTINYYEFPEHENTLSESSKLPHFLLFTHEGDNFHLSKF